MPWQRGARRPSRARAPAARSARGRPELSRAELCEPRADGERLALGLSLRRAARCRGRDRRRRARVSRPRADRAQRTSASACSSGSPRSARWPRARPRAAQSARGHGGAGGSAPAAPRGRSRCARARRRSARPAAQLAETVTASLDYLRPVALRASRSTWSSGPRRRSRSRSRARRGRSASSDTSTRRCPSSRPTASCSASRS